MSNNRKAKRQTCLVPVEGKEGGVFDQTQTVDFSKGGLGFISSHRIPVNKRIPIEIDLTSEGNPIFVIGRVQWVRRIEDSKAYRIGVSFTDIINGSKSRLTQYFRENKEG